MQIQLELQNLFTLLYTARLVFSHKINLILVIKYILRVKIIFYRMVITKFAYVANATQ